ncbi:MAG TPA: polysaccharide lyase 6 family protein [Sphingomonas sp.]|nr:polysaccharide lyase 6 family protein [Sphingomonas sp.]
MSRLVCNAMLSISLASLATAAPARNWLVHDIAELNAARPAAGDTIVLADGTWRDATLKLVGEGTAAKPITLTAEHPDKVILTGRSNLKLAGSYLIASNLVFRDGYTPDDVVVSFRTDSRHWANHSRITGIVIDRFTQPDRRKEDHWVALYGADNRVDHSQFEGKGNDGATMVVIRDKPYPLDNRARIDHNYFGPRPPLGGNGGETLRIGTSTESGSDSHSVVEDNLFDRCDGEVEIISVKSGANVIRNNLFVDSQGTLTLRHGNGNTVERNVFFGHGIPHTGGIRVINERQTVRGNYLEGLVGEDFRSAITVMNGVPNSPINRYLPVKHALIANNSVIDPAEINLGGGADAERSVPPESTRFVDDLIVNAKGADPIHIGASIAGITFENVVQSPAGKPAAPGIERRPVTLARADNGLLYPTDPALAKVGAPRDLKPVTRDEVGVPWYPKGGSVPVALGSGTTHKVTPAQPLADAVAAARSGDVLQLAAGRYRVAAPIVVDRPLTLTAAVGGNPTIAFSGATLFRIENGGSLALKGLAITGAEAPRRPGNAVIRTSAAPMTGAYALTIQDCTFTDMAGAPGFDIVRTTLNTFARAIAITGSRFDAISGTVVAGNERPDDKGFYTVRDVTIADSAFRRVGRIAILSRGGKDESSLGPRFAMTGSTIEDSGREGGAIVLWGVQATRIADNRFHASGGIRETHTVGSPHTTIARNLFDATPAPLIDELYYKGPPRAVVADNLVRGA